MTFCGHFFELFFSKINTDPKSSKYHPESFSGCSRGPKDHFLCTFGQLEMNQKKFFFEHFPSQNRRDNSKITWADFKNKENCFPTTRKNL